MDDKTWLGATAEAKAISVYVHNRWDVFVQTSGKAPFDLLVHKDGLIRRVQIKGCATLSKSNSYAVQLRSIRSNRNGNTIHLFDNAKSDELAIYIEPLDQVFFFSSIDILNTSGITINPLKLEEYQTIPNLERLPSATVSALEKQSGS